MGTLADNQLNPRRGDVELQAARRLSPSTVRDLLLVGLTVSSGAVDAISFLALGSVFTAFMTGNIVFLGFGISGAGGPGVVRVGIALIAFVAGALLSAKIVKASEGSGLWPRGVSVALGVGALAQAGFVAIWVAASGHPSLNESEILISLFALAMGLQTNAVRSLDLPGVFTTAATASLAVFVSDVQAWSRPGADRRRLAGVIVGLFVGATAGALLLAHARVYAPLLPLLGTVIVISVASSALSRHVSPRVIKHSPPTAGTGHAAAR